MVLIKEKNVKKFWDLRNSAEGVKLYIYGDIEATQFWGDELTPDIIRQQLDACSGPMEMHINSPGGDVFAGMAIYNLLKRYEDDITVYIDGLAASIASVIRAKSAGTSGSLRPSILMRLTKDNR